MIQRIQTVFLVIVAAGLAIFLGTDSYTKILSSTESIVLNPFKLTQFKSSGSTAETPVYYIAVVAGLSLCVTIFTIFQYKNRIRQMLFVALNSLMIAVATGISIFHIQNDLPKINGEGGQYGLGLYAIFVSLIANWLANRFIRRDEKMVKDSERMR